MVYRSEGQWLCIILTEVLRTGGQLGQETDVVSQICHRCLIPGEIHLPAITSAFARLSILGRVFIEASMS
jgi:hypothetical protein